MMVQSPKSKVQSSKPFARGYGPESKKTYGEQKEVI
jgi:hypothetical protein